MQKRVLNPARLRRPPAQFSWVDQRLVRDGHLRRCRPDAAALYLFLVTVADARGLSFYGDASVCCELALPPARLTRARRQLLAVGLIAWEAPLYQVLALDSASASEGVAAPPPLPTPPRLGAVRSVAECLRRALEETP
jgi:hypothetical protein